MRSLVLIGAFAALIACTSRDVGPYAPTAQDKSNEQLAVQNAQCAFENQNRCSHVVENRILLSRFFAPEGFGGMDESEKFRGRRVTTKFIVEAAAGIQQCTKVFEDSVILLKNIDINGGKWQMKATKPVSPTANCFITLEIPEAS